MPRIARQNIFCISEYAAGYYSGPVVPPSTEPRYIIRCGEGRDNYQIDPLWYLLKKIIHFFNI